MSTDSPTGTTEADPQAKAMRHVRNCFEYSTDKDHGVVRKPDPRIVVPAAEVYEQGEQVDRQFPRL